MVLGNTLNNATKSMSSLRPSFLPEMDLHCPTSLDELFGHMDDGAQLLSGGTDILLQAGQTGSPDHLVWTGGINALKEFVTEGDRLKIGASVPLSQMIKSQSFRKAAPAVNDGASVVGSTQLRRQATMVGNVCTASPAADTVPGLLVHDCVVEIKTVDGKSRSVDLKYFITGPGKTTLAEGELVTSLSLTPLGQNQTSAYQRFTYRKALDLAFACVAARLDYEEDHETIKSVQLALGAVGPTVIDASSIADVLIGQPLDNIQLGKCAEVASELCTPISDHRASADYRRQLIKALVGDVILQAANRLKGSS